MGRDIFVLLLLVSLIGISTARKGRESEEEGDNANDDEDIKRDRDEDNDSRGENEDDVDDEENDVDDADDDDGDEESDEDNKNGKGKLQDIADMQDLQSMLTQDVKNKEFVSVGCFVDAPPRAINGGSVIYQNDSINSCYLKAKKAGNEYFAVQNKSECFTSGDAKKTYDKYGATTGCLNGTGAAWKNDVYRIIVLCKMRCHNGFQADKNGSVICKCLPPVLCKLRCHNGSEADKNGSVICKRLPPVLCKLRCHNGFQAAKNGSVICKCLPPVTLNAFVLFPKVFIEITMNPMITGKKFVPENCYATPTKHTSDHHRIHLIKHRVTVVKSYEQIVLSGRMFRFSVLSSFATYVHCDIRVCPSNTRGCGFPRHKAATVVPATKGNEQYHNEDEISDELVHSTAKIQQLRS